MYGAEKARVTSILSDAYCHVQQGDILVNTGLCIYISTLTGNFTTICNSLFHQNCNWKYLTQIGIVNRSLKSLSFPNIIRSVRLRGMIDRELRQFPSKNFSFTKSCFLAFEHRLCGNNVIDTVFFNLHKPQEQVDPWNI